MRIESKEFTKVSDYDSVFTNFKNKIVSKLNFKGNLKLTYSLYSLYGYRNGKWVMLLNGPKSHQKYYMRTFDDFSKCKLITNDLYVEKG